jgi:hypothetical protein
MSVDDLFFYYNPIEDYSISFEDIGHLYIETPNFVIDLELEKTRKLYEAMKKYYEK